MTAEKPDFQKCECGEKTYKVTTLNDRKIPLCESHYYEMEAWLSGDD